MADSIYDLNLRDCILSMPLSCTTYMPFNFLYDGNFSIERARGASEVCGSDIDLDQLELLLQGRPQARGTTEGAWLSTHA